MYMGEKNHKDVAQKIDTFKRYDQMVTVAFSFHKS